jgi:hypothetical protein
VAAFVGFVVLFPFLTTKHAFRQAVERQPSLNVVERIELFLDITADAVTSDRAEFFERATSTSQQRTSMLGTFAFVVEATPSRVPFWGGATYKNVMWTLVPRLIAPGKPKKSLGQDFGHRYGLLLRSDHNTSYNLPQIVEMYANFGKLGVIFGMFLLGLYYRVLNELLNHGTEGGVLTCIGAIVLTDLMNMESDASLVLAAVPQTLFVTTSAMLVVIWLSGQRTGFTPVRTQ